MYKLFVTTIMWDDVTVLRVNTIDFNEREEADIAYSCLLASNKGNEHLIQVNVVKLYKDED